jgi:hypothetical protein
MDINLSDKYYLAEGSCRTVYRHPNNQELCIKINHNPEKDRNITEVVFYKKHSKQSLDFITNFAGTIDTNLGKGVVTQIVLDHDGNVSKSLEDYMEERTITLKQALSYITDLKDKVFKYGVLLHDDGIQNILMRKNQDGTFTPVLVDGFGPRDMTVKALIYMVLRPLAKHKSAKIIKNMSKRASLFNIHLSKLNPLS